MNTNTENILPLRKNCARLPQVTQPMKNSTTAAPTAKSSGRRSYNIRMDRDLIETLNDYCGKNRRAGKSCDVLERAILDFLKRKARKYRLRLPQHLLT